MTMNIWIISEFWLILLDVVLQFLSTKLDLICCVNVSKSLSILVQDLKKHFQEADFTHSL